MKIVDTAQVDDETWYSLLINDEDFAWLSKCNNNYYMHPGSCSFGGFNYYKIDVPEELYTIMKLALPYQLTQ